MMSAHLNFTVTSPEKWGWTNPSDFQLESVSKELFKALDTTKTLETNYAIILGVLRRVYNAGRTRGAYEASEGAR